MSGIEIMRRAAGWSVAPMVRPAGNTAPAVPPVNVGGRVLDLVGQALGTTGTTINTVLTSGNERAIAQLNADAQVALARIQAQMRSTEDAQTVAQLRTQLEALQQMNAATNAIRAQYEERQRKTLLYVGGGVVATAVVVGAVYLMGRPRSNPWSGSWSGGNVIANPVIGRGRKRRYVAPPSRPCRRR